MPEPDLEVDSLYGSEYGRERPVNPRKVTRELKIVAQPEPDEELESLADFKSQSTTQKS